MPTDHDTEMFWTRVISLCKQKGLKQAELARLSGFGIGQLSTAIKRASMPSVDRAIEIAKVLNTTAEYLVTGKTASEDPVLDSAFEDIRLGKRTREIALILPILKDKDADIIIAMLDSLGYDMPKLDLQEGPMVPHPKNA